MLCPYTPPVAVARRAFFLRLFWKLTSRCTSQCCLCCSQPRSRANVLQQSGILPAGGVGVAGAFSPRKKTPDASGLFPLHTAVHNSVDTEELARMLSWIHGLDEIVHGSLFVVGNLRRPSKNCGRVRVVAMDQCALHVCAVWKQTCRLLDCSSSKKKQQLKNIARNLSRIFPTLKYHQVLYLLAPRAFCLRFSLRDGVLFCWWTPVCRLFAVLCVLKRPVVYGDITQAWMDTGRSPTAACACAHTCSLGTVCGQAAERCAPTLYFLFCPQQCCC